MAGHGPVKRPAERQWGDHFPAERQCHRGDHLVGSVSQQAVEAHRFDRPQRQRFAREAGLDRIANLGKHGGNGVAVGGEGGIVFPVAGNAQGQAKGRQRRNLNHLAASPDCMETYPELPPVTVVQSSACSC